MRVGFILLAFTITAACQSVQPSEQENAAVNKMLDDWHLAAAQADAQQYFGMMEAGAIFIGTDDTERWTKEEFAEWSKPYFDRGKAWSFTADCRWIYFSKDGKTAWFDEQLDTPNLGPSRGSGVLTKTALGWKIRHYVLSIPIPNDIQKEVTRQVLEFLAKES